MVRLRRYYPHTSLPIILTHAVSGPPETERYASGVLTELTMSIIFRESTTDDIPDIVEIKVEMFYQAELSHLLPDNACDVISEDYATLYSEGLACHQLAISDGRAVAMSGAFIKDDLPFKYFKTPIYGYIGDVFTLQLFRRQGLSKALNMKSIDWLRTRGVRTIRLHASRQAKGLYRGIGFTDSSEMVLHVEA